MEQQSVGLAGLVEEMVSALCDEPHLGQVDAKTENGILTLRVRVAPGDVGKVIGKKGGTARSIRIILGAAARKQGIVCQLDICNDRNEVSHGDGEE
jgi:predicted RNA-binding protein YlqC (UPF0109 family)